MIDSNWDSDQVAFQFSGCETVRDVIVHLEGQAAARGEVICEIRLNGRILEEEDETRLASDPRTAIRELSIRCDRPEHLIGQALKSAISFIPLLLTRAIHSLQYSSKSDTKRRWEKTHDLSTKRHKKRFEVKPLRHF